MNQNFVHRLQNLRTIKDFDLAVNVPQKEVHRIKSLQPNLTVAESDVNFMIWLLVEKEFGFDNDKFSKPESTTSGTDSDSTDAASTSSSSADGNRIQADGHWHKSKNRRSSKQEQALRYAEELLAAVGVNIPFQCLSPEERNGLCNLFRSSSNLLIQEEYRSLSELYCALRRRSRFREEFTLLSRLGSGNFGTVFSVKRKAATMGRTYALKRVIITLDLYNYIPMILNESSILKSVVGNDHVVKYYDSWLAMEPERPDGDEGFSEEFGDPSLLLHSHSGYSPYGSSSGVSSSNMSRSSAATLVGFEEGSYVFYLLMEQYWINLKQWRAEFPDEILSFEQLREIARGLVDGIEWIHSKGYLHLDINPKNILWKNESKSSVVISDFGLAVKGPTFGDRVGTIPYCAPEKPLNAKSDIYSLGVSLFEISQNFATTSEFLHKLDTREFSTGTELLDEILPLMLNHRPQQRPTASELKIRFFEEPTAPTSHINDESKER